MKKSFWIIFLWVFATLVLAADIEVKLTGISSDDGSVIVALFADGESELFPEDEPERAKITDAQEGEIKIIFESVPDGEYAIAAFHDENDNGFVDKNGIGLPEEDYGNTGLRAARKPLFENSKFTVDSSDLEIEIKLE